MASSSDSVRKQSGHASSKLVEDFVNLSLEEAPYKSLHNHTENLMEALKKKGCNVDDEVRKNILPVLAAILDHSDHRHKAQLQETFLHILKNIADDAVKTDVYDMLVEADVLPQLLKLLKLHAEKPLALHIISLISKIRSVKRKAFIRSQRKCMEVLLDTVKRTSPEIKRSALDLVRITISEDMPSPKAIRKYLSELNYFLRDKDDMIVEATCPLYTEIVNKGSEEVIKAMLSTGCLPHLVDVLSRTPQNKPLSVATTHVLHCLCILASKSPQYVEQLLKIEFLKVLYPYMDPSLKLKHAHWIAAYIIDYSDDSLADDMIEENMLPRLELIWPEGLKKKDITLVNVLRRLFDKIVFLENHLDEGILDYLLTVNASENFFEMQKLLKIMLDFLVERDEEKILGIRKVLISDNQNSKLRKLCECTNITVKTLAERILKICGKPR